jgi:hypothetical protein
MKKRHAATHIKRSVRYPGRRQFIRHAACNITRSGTQSHTHTHKIVRFSQFAGEQVCLPTCVRRGVIRPYKGLPLSRVHCKSCSSLSAHTFFKILRCREMHIKKGALNVVGVECALPACRLLLASIQRRGLQFKGFWDGPKM